MTNCSGSNVTALPGPHTPTPTSYNTLSGRRIEAEKMQPPSFWSTALYSVEECAMALFQQSILEVLTMATHDEGLARERT